MASAAGKAQHTECINENPFKLSWVGSSEKLSEEEKGKIFELLFQSIMSTLKVELIRGRDYKTTKNQAIESLSSHYIKLWPKSTSLLWLGMGGGHSHQKQLKELIDAIKKDNIEEITKTFNEVIYNQTEGLLYPKLTKIYKTPEVGTEGIDKREGKESNPFYNEAQARTRREFTARLDL